MFLKIDKQVLAATIILIMFSAAFLIAICLG